MRRLTILSLILALLLGACSVNPPAFPLPLPQAGPQVTLSVPPGVPEVAIDTLPASPTRTPMFAPAETAPAVTQIPALPSPTQSGAAGEPAGTETGTGTSASAAPAAETPAPLETAEPFIPGYTIQPGTPITTTNFLHLEQGCGWAGLSGQVFDRHGLPVTGLVVEVRGAVDGQEVQAQGTTGAAASLGSGGYEIEIQGSQVQVGGLLLAQVFQDGQPVSEPASFSLAPGCENNLVVLNFIATGPNTEKNFLYLPSLSKAEAPTP